MEDKKQLTEEILGPIYGGVDSFSSPSTNLYEQIAKDPLALDESQDSSVGSSYNININVNKEIPLPEIKSAVTGVLATNTDPDEIKKNYSKSSKPNNVTSNLIPATNELQLPEFSNLDTSRLSLYQGDNGRSLQLPEFSNINAQYALPYVSSNGIESNMVPESNSEYQIGKIGTMFTSTLTADAASSQPRDFRGNPIENSERQWKIKNPEHIDFNIDYDPTGKHYQKYDQNPGERPTVRKGHDGGIDTPVLSISQQQMNNLVDTYRANDDRGAFDTGISRDIGLLGQGLKDVASGIASVFTGSLDENSFTENTRNALDSQNNRKRSYESSIEDLGSQIKNYVGQNTNADTYEQQMSRNVRTFRSINAVVDNQIFDADAREKIRIDLQKQLLGDQDAVDRIVKFEQEAPRELFERAAVDLGTAETIDPTAISTSSTVENNLLDQKTELVQNARNLSSIALLNARDGSFSSTMIEDYMTRQRAEEDIIHYNTPTETGNASSLTTNQINVNDMTTALSAIPGVGSLFSSINSANTSQETSNSFDMTSNENNYSVQANVEQPQTTENVNYNYPETLVGGEINQTSQVTNNNLSIPQQNINDITSVLPGVGNATQSPTSSRISSQTSPFNKLIVPERPPVFSLDDPPSISPKIQAQIDAERDAAKKLLDAQLESVKNKNVLPEGTRFIAVDQGGGEMRLQDLRGGNNRLMTPQEIIEQSDAIGAQTQESIARTKEFREKIRQEDEQKRLLDAKRYEEEYGVPAPWMNQTSNEETSSLSMEGTENNYNINNSVNSSEYNYPDSYVGSQIDVNNQSLPFDSTTINESPVIIEGSENNYSTVNQSPTTNVENNYNVTNQSSNIVNQFDQSPLAIEGTKNNYNVTNQLSNVTNQSSSTNNQSSNVTNQSSSTNNQSSNVTNQSSSTNNQSSNVTNQSSSTNNQFNESPVAIEGAENNYNLANQSSNTNTIEDVTSSIISNSPLTTVANNAIAGGKMYTDFISGAISSVQNLFTSNDSTDPKTTTIEGTENNYNITNQTSNTDTNIIGDVTSSIISNSPLETVANNAIAGGKMYTDFISGAVSSVQNLFTSNDSTDPKTTTIEGTENNYNVTNQTDYNPSQIVEETNNNYNTDTSNITNQTNIVNASNNNNNSQSTTLLSSSTSGNQTNYAINESDVDFDINNEFEFGNQEFLNTLVSSPFEFVAENQTQVTNINQSPTQTNNTSSTTNNQTTNNLSPSQNNNYSNSQLNSYNTQITNISRSPGDNNIVQLIKNIINEELQLKQEEDTQSQMVSSEGESSGEEEIELVQPEPYEDTNVLENLVNDSGSILTIIQNTSGPPIWRTTLG